MLVRDSKLGMKEVRRMQVLKRFFVDRQVYEYTRSTATNADAAAACCQDPATVRETRTVRLSGRHNSIPIIITRLL